MDLCRFCPSKRLSNFTEHELYNLFCYDIPFELLRVTSIKWECEYECTLECCERVFSKRIAMGVLYRIWNHGSSMTQLIGEK